MNFHPSPSIAVIGLAISHAERFSELLKPHGIRVACVWDEDFSKAAAFAECHGAQPVADREALPWAELSGAIITTRTRDHAAAALPFLERGLPVFLDKQLALRWEEALLLQAAAERGGTSFLSGSIRRYAPSYQSIFRHLRERSGDEILSVHFYEPHGVQPGHWQDAPEQSGGFLMNIGIHAADPLFGLGLDKISDIYATTARITHHDALSEDVATIIIRYQTGSIATLELMGAQQPIIATQPTLRVHTRQTTLHARLPEGGASFHSGPPLYDPETYDHLSGSLHAARALAMLFKEKIPAVAIAEQLSVLKLLLLARRSAQENRPIPWEGTLPQG